MGRRRRQSAYARQVEAEEELERKYRLARRERASEGVPREKEKRYGQLHRKAATKRRTSAREVDRQARVHGDTLGWYAVIDDATTPECAAAHGQNFRVDQPPAIGWPGTVHSECRCRPGPPHASGGLLSTGSVEGQPSNMNNLIRQAVAGARAAARRIFGRE